MVFKKSVKWTISLVCTISLLISLAALFHYYMHQKTQPNHCGMTYFSGSLEPVHAPHPLYSTFKYKDDPAVLNPLSEYFLQPEDYDYSKQTTYTDAHLKNRGDLVNSLVFFIPGNAGNPWQSRSIGSKLSEFTTILRDIYADNKFQHVNGTTTVFDVTLQLSFASSVLSPSGVISSPSSVPKYTHITSSSSQNNNHVVDNSLSFPNPMHSIFSNDEFISHHDGKSTKNGIPSLLASSNDVITTMYTFDFAEQMSAFSGDKINEQRQYVLETILAQINALRRTSQGDVHISLVGHSMGGVVALALADELHGIIHSKSTPGEPMQGVKLTNIITVGTPLTPIYVPDWHMAQAYMNVTNYLHHHNDCHHEAADMLRHGSLSRSDLHLSDIASRVCATNIVHFNGAEGDLQVSPVYTSSNVLSHLSGILDPVLSVSNDGADHSVSPLPSQLFESSSQFQSSQLSHFRGLSDHLCLAWCSQLTESIASILLRSSILNSLEFHPVHESSQQVVTQLHTSVMLFQQGLSAFERYEVNHLRAIPTDLDTLSTVFEDHINHPHNAALHVEPDQFDRSMLSFSYHDVINHAISYKQGLFLNQTQSSSGQDSNSDTHHDNTKTNTTSVLHPPALTRSASLLSVFPSLGSQNHQVESERVLLIASMLPIHVQLCERSHCINVPDTTYHHVNVPALQYPTINGHSQSNPLLRRSSDDLLTLDALALKALPADVQKTIKSRYSAEQLATPSVLSNGNTVVVLNEHIVDGLIRQHNLSRSTTQIVVTIDTLSQQSLLSTQSSIIKGYYNNDVNAYIKSHLPRQDDRNIPLVWSEVIQAPSTVNAASSSSPREQRVTVTPPTLLTSDHVHTGKELKPPTPLECMEFTAAYSLSYPYSIPSLSVRFTIPVSKQSEHQEQHQQWASIQVDAHHPLLWYYNQCTDDVLVQIKNNRYIAVSSSHRSRAPPLVIDRVLGTYTSHSQLRLNDMQLLNTTSFLSHQQSHGGSNDIVRLSHTSSPLAIFSSWRSAVFSLLFPQSSASTSSANTTPLVPATTAYHDEHMDLLSASATIGLLRVPKAFKYSITHSSEIDMTGIATTQQQDLTTMYIPMLLPLQANKLPTITLPLSRPQELAAVIPTAIEIHIDSIVHTLIALGPSALLCGLQMLVLYLTLLLSGVTKSILTSSGKLTPSTEPAVQQTKSRSSMLSGGVFHLFLITMFLFAVVAVGIVSFATISQYNPSILVAVTDAFAQSGDSSRYHTIQHLFHNLSTAIFTCREIFVVTFQHIWLSVNWLLFHVVPPAVYISLLHWVSVITHHPVVCSAAQWLYDHSHVFYHHYSYPHLLARMAKDSNGSGLVDYLIINVIYYTLAITIAWLLLHLLRIILAIITSYNPLTAAYQASISIMSKVLPTSIQDFYDISSKFWIALGLVFPLLVTIAYLIITLYIPAVVMDVDQIYAPQTSLSTQPTMIDSLLNYLLSTRPGLPLLHKIRWIALVKLPPIFYISAQHFVYAGCECKLILYYGIHWISRQLSGALPSFILRLPLVSYFIEQLKQLTSYATSSTFTCKNYFTTPTVNLGVKTALADMFSSTYGLPPTGTLQPPTIDYTTITPDNLPTMVTNGELSSIMNAINPFTLFPSHPPQLLPLPLSNITFMMMITAFSILLIIAGFILLQVYIRTVKPPESPYIPHGKEDDIKTLTRVDHLQKVFLRNYTIIFTSLLIATGLLLVLSTPYMYVLPDTADIIANRRYYAEYAEEYFNPPFPAYITPRRSHEDESVPEAVSLPYTLESYLTNKYALLLDDPLGHPITLTDKHVIPVKRPHKISKSLLPEIYMKTVRPYLNKLKAFSLPALMLRKPQHYQQIQSAKHASPTRPSVRKGAWTPYIPVDLEIQLTSRVILIYILFHIIATLAILAYFSGIQHYRKALLHVYVNDQQHLDLLHHNTLPYPSKLIGCARLAVRAAITFVLLNVTYTLLTAANSPLLMAQHSTESLPLLILVVLMLVAQVC